MEKSFNKKYLDKDVILTIFVNLFLANLWPHGFILGFFIAMCVKFTDGKSILCSILMICIVFLSILRLFWLPILYKHMETNSKNEFIKKFICNIKNSRIYRVKILALTILMSFFIALAFDTDMKTLFFIFISLFICSIILVLLKLCVFPILYKNMSQIKQLQLLYKFIYNLKMNKSFQFIFLYVFEVILFLYLLYFLVGYSILQLFSSLIQEYWIILIFFDLFGSYLVLFLWWKLRGELKNIDK